VVWTFIILVFMAVALTVAGLAWMVHAQRKRNRFGRHDVVVAPLHWLYTPGEGQRLHRRLLASVAAARRAALAADGRRAVPGGLVEIVDDLERQAGAIDDGLIAASKLSLGRRHEAYAHLRDNVHELEEVAMRLVRLSTEWDRGLRPAVDTERLNQRLDALEESVEEVAALERAWLKDL
jgi:hypothetical protein